MGRVEFNGSGAIEKKARSGDARAGEDTYIPAFSEIAGRLGLSSRVLDDQTVTIPTKLFRFLMTLQLRRLPFDERAYANANPDVARAHEKGEISSLFEHFIGTGWFEDRPTGWHFVDERWYKQRYFDLAVAQKTGKVGDLSQHFYRTGRREGRVASAMQLAAKEEWDRALGPDD